MRKYFKDVDHEKLKSNYYINKYISNNINGSLE